MIYDVVVKLFYNGKKYGKDVERLWIFNKLNSFGCEGFPFCNLIKNGNKISNKKKNIFYSLWVVANRMKTELLLLLLLLL